MSSNKQARKGKQKNVWNFLFAIVFLSPKDSQAQGEGLRPRLWCFPPAVKFTTMKTNVWQTFRRIWFLKTILLSWCSFNPSSVQGLVDTSTKSFGMLSNLLTVKTGTTKVYFHVIQVENHEKNSPSFLLKDDVLYFYVFAQKTFRSMQSNLTK